MTNRMLAALASPIVELRDLKVLHWRGARVPGVPAAEPQSGLDWFPIDTCQRRVAVVASSEAAALARAEFPADGALESFAGNDAYAFLLRFACGLESKLIAETEIFGQIKQAWREFSERGSPLARALSPLDAAAVPGRQGDARAVPGQSRQRLLRFADAAAAGRGRPRRSDAADRRRPAGAVGRALAHRLANSGSGIAPASARTSCRGSWPSANRRARCA